MDPQPPVSIDESGAGRSSGLMVLLAFVGLTWVVMGFGSTAKYFQSEDHIGQTLRHMVEAGKTSTIEQCVDEVLVWRPECTALAGLCDGSIDRVMSACLSAQDRTDECLALRDDIGNTGLGVDQCRARGIERRQGQDKECAKSYGQVSAYCKALLPNAFAHVVLRGQKR